MTITEQLFALQDQEYRIFQCKLVPNVQPRCVIGIRTPALRALAKQLSGSPEAADFIATLPHDYYDEYNLHGFLLQLEKDYDTVVRELDRFLTYVDNWATCDLLRPKAFDRMAKKDPERLLADIRRWMLSPETYICRFGMEMLMSWYLDDALFRPEFLEWVCSIRSNEYYVQMMQAWFMATALAKQYEATLPYIREPHLDKWTHNKAIQKARESFRITPEQKNELNAMKM